MEWNVKMLSVRILTHWFFVKLFLVLALNSIKPSEDATTDVCPVITHEQTQNPFCTSSDSPCLNKSIDLLRRHKSKETWNNISDCVLTQKVIENPCPETALYRNNMCIFIIENTGYPPKCPYEETLGFNKYVDAIDPQYFPIWMPVIREIGDYGIGIFHWMEPSTAYKLPYDFCDNTFCSPSPKDSITRNNCMIFHNRTHTKAVTCDQSHNAVCAYEVLTNKNRSFCSQSNAPVSVCKQSDYSTKSKCFCLGTPESNITQRAEFLQPYQNLIYYSFSTDVCSIGLERRGDVYVWSESNLTVNYTNWAVGTVFAQNYIFGGISLKGWILTQSREELNCTVYQKDTSKASGGLILTYHENSTVFILTLDNPTSWVHNSETGRPLIFCFSDATTEKIFERIDVGKNYDENSATFFFAPLTEGPGNYWCEGFLYPNMEVKKSNKYLLRGDTEEYIVILSITYSRGSNPLTESGLKYFPQLLQHSLQNTSVNISFYPRIFKVIAIDEKSSNITINFHLTTQTSSKSPSYYTVLRNLTENILENFFFENFLVADLCLGVQTIQNDSVIVTWPMTQINNVSPRPREGWCLDSHGAIINRLCEGNFVDGARWTDLKESCNIISPANITLNLTNTINSNDPEKYIDEITELAQNYEKFETRDVYLFSEFLRQLLNEPPLIFTSILEIISNIGMTPADILKESQIIYQTTDRILDTVERLKDTSDSTTFISTPKVTFISSSFEYQVQHAHTVTLESVPFSITFSNYIEMWNSSGIFQLIINETVLKSVNETQRFKIIVTIYNDTSFFSGFFDEQSSSAIVSVHIPQIKETVDATLVYPMAILDESPYCSNWVYEIDKTFGYWDYVSKVELKNNKLVCKFSNLKNFGLVIPTNITNELQYLIQSYISSREKSNRLLTLVKSYSKFFQVKDVVHVAKILSEFSPVQKEEELTVIADIFDGLIDMEEGILEEVQLQFGSTDNILSSFDYLLSEYKSPIRISRKNIFISILSINRYYGNEFIMKHCEKYCTIDPTSKTGAEQNDVEIIVSVSSPIENQKSDLISTAMLTLFSKNSLFISGKGMPRENFSKIIGLLFPKMYNSSSINIRYRFDNRTYNHTCGIWQEFQWIHNSSTSPKFDDGFHSCYHRGDGYTALFSDKVDTVIILEKILNSNQSIETLLEKTVLVLQTYYPEFEADGIHVITKILKKVIEVNENIIQLCVNIINHIMNIRREVLIETQVKYQATDQILDYLWKIVELIEYNVENYTLIYPNIRLTIFPLEKNGPIGVEITKFETTYTSSLLWEKPIEKKNINPKSTTITLSQELKDEILNNSSSVPYKVIVAMLLNDALFNEPNRSRNVGPIFKIAIPKYNTSLKHSILYHWKGNDYGGKSKCAHWNYSENIKGSWEIWRPLVNNSTCRFLRQGYFSVILGEYFNITKALEKISASVVPGLEKLEEMEDISYLYDQFKPIDLKLLFEILREVMDLDKRSLEVIKKVADNIFAISSSILNQSQIDYGALKTILDIINKIGKYLDTNVSYNVSEKFSILVCLVNESVGIAFNESLSCLKPEHMEEYYTAKIILSKTLINHIMVDASGTDDLKIIFTVFYDNVLFVDEKNSPTTHIFGLAIPHPRKNLKDNISFFYSKNEFYNLPLTCSYWKYKTNNHGRWLEVKTSETSLYKSCLFRSAGYFALLKESPKNLTEQLQSIQQDTESYSEKLSDLWNILFENEDTIEPSHVFITSTILNSHEVESDEVLMLIGNITSLMMDLNRTILTDSQQQYSATDWILHSVDTLIANYKGNTSLLFTNLAMVISSNIVGIAFKRNYDRTWMMKVISTESPYEKLTDVDALLVIDHELRNQIQQTSTSIKIIVYFNDALFHGKYNDTKRNVGIIVGAALSNMSEAKLSGHIRILYRSIENSTDICANWKYTTDGKHIESTLHETKVTYSNLMSVCENEVDGSHIALLKIERNITNQLQDILNSLRPVDKQLEEVFSILENNVQHITSYDVFLIGEIIGKLVDESSISLNQTTVVSKIVSHLFLVEKSVLRQSQQEHQATDRILYYIDNILKKLPYNIESGAIIQDHFTIIRYELKNSGIVGFMLSSCNNKKCAVSVLTEKMNITKISNNKDFNMALLLSKNLYQQIEENGESVQLVTSIFFNDDFFNEKSQMQYTTSKIFGVLLIGLKKHMTADLSLIYSTEKHQVFDSYSCAFWNYLTDGEKFIGGSWKKEVGQQEAGKTIICEFKHITHFVLLLADSDILDEATEHILDIITNINSVLSLLGLFGILLTTVLFDRWRNNTGNQILINFSLAVSIKNVMLYISVGVYTENGTGIGCSITGAILHYSILAEFCWMLIIAILQFKRFVEVLGGPLKYVLLKACICGWVFPALPVFLVIIIDVHNYSQGQLHLCYPSGLWLYLAVWLPLLIIVVINSVIFFFIIYNVFHNKTVLRDQTNHEVLFQWRLALLLFTMLGLTWLFGFLGLLSVSKVCLVLFSFSASLQGFLMFLFFIVFNKKTRFLYTQSFRWWLYSKGYRNHYT